MEGGWGRENMSRKNGEAAVSTHRCARISVGYPPPVTIIMSASAESKLYGSLYSIAYITLGSDLSVWDVSGGAVHFVRRRNEDLGRARCVGC